MRQRDGKPPRRVLSPAMRASRAASAPRSRAATFRAPGLKTSAAVSGRHHFPDRLRRPAARCRWRWLLGLARGLSSISTRCSGSGSAVDRDRLPVDPPPTPDRRRWTLPATGAGQYRRPRPTAPAPTSRACSSKTGSSRRRAGARPDRRRRSPAGRARSRSACGADTDDRGRRRSGAPRSIRRAWPAASRCCSKPSDDGTTGAVPFSGTVEWSKGIDETRPADAGRQGQHSGAQPRRRCH